MGEALRLAGYREPLGLWVRSASRVAASPDLHARELEFSSRGDRVAGHLILPAQGAAPLPVVLLQPDGGAGRETLETIGAAWAQRGAAVASIDLPLHGARADRKLLEQLPGSSSGAAAWRTELAREFTRQAVIDFERTLDALATLEWIDVDRIAFVGFGLGARLGAAFCALDARVRAAVLAPWAGAPATPGADPADWVPRIAPRPVLLLRSRGDAGEDAAGGAGAEHLAFDARPAELPGAAAEEIARFLARTTLP